jgi:hypothetical protein
LLFWFFSLVFSVLLGVGSVLVSVFVSAVFLVFAAWSLVLGVELAVPVLFFDLVVFPWSLFCYHVI